MREGGPDYTFASDSEAARILRDSATWPASEWMALSPERRLFLFQHARTFGGDPAELDAIALGIIDRLIAERKGAEVEDWIGHRGGSAEMQQAIWGGERGERLLSLDDSSGFRERSVIALHRGVQLLEAGDLQVRLARSRSRSTLRASRARRPPWQALSLRWLSFVAAQFSIDDELLTLLQALTPPLEYAKISRTSCGTPRSTRTARRSIARCDIRWGAARSSSGSICCGRSRAATWLVSRNKSQRELDESPATTLRFLKQLVERLETEDAGVRSAQAETVRNVRRMALPLTLDEGNKGGQARQAQALVERCQSLLDGLGELEADARSRARSVAPGNDVFAGSVRLAPSDPLPWPFPAPTVQAPSVFLPLTLRPEEWRAPSGELVFGWSIEG
jgi:hypothetical protein